MKISELEARLKKIREMHGDLPVLTQNYCDQLLTYTDQFLEIGDGIYQHDPYDIETGKGVSKEGKYLCL